MSVFSGSAAILGDMRSAEHKEILSPDAIQFLGELHVLFNARRKDLLEARLRRRAQGSLSLTPLASPGAVAAADVHHLSAQSSFSANPAMQLNFLPETASVRKDPSWRVASIPADLQDRHVEITGPVDRKMVINALNSGAQVFMADFEDSHAPTWEGTIAGQYNLKYAVRGTLSLTVPASTNAGAGSATAAKAKTYELNKTGRLATLMVRPRGWHLHENHVLFDGEPASASLCDFGLYFYHNAAALVAKGSGPYFYLPKMESYLEARLWNDVFAYAQQRLGIPYGTVRATCLIETLPAVVQIEEILYELRHHSAGLNCGRWDYIFSAIKTLGRNTNTSNSSATSRSSGVNANGVSLAEAQALGAFVLPDRQAVTMTVPWMAAYVQQLVATCHRRGAHAMGGMSAQIPIKGDDAANAAAMDRVRADKLREVTAGHDGTWVAHPALIPVAKEVFNRHMKTANQIPEEALSARSRAEGTAQDHYYGAAPVVASKPGGAIFVPDGYFNTGNTSTNASNVSGFVKSYHDVTATCSDGNNHSASAHSASAYDLFAVSTSAHALSNSTGNVNNNSNLGAAGIFGVTGHPHSTSGQSTSSHATNAGGVACAGVWGAGSAAAAHSHHDRIGSNNVIGVDYNNTNSDAIATQLSTPSGGDVTLPGIRNSVSVAVQYMEAFLRGIGCIPVNNMMEDAATAEICRVQLWQYRAHGIRTVCGTKVDAALLKSIVAEHETATRTAMGVEKYNKSKFALAHSLLLDSLLSVELDDFITSKCYPYICTVAVPAKL